MRKLKPRQIIVAKFIADNKYARRADVTKHFGLDSKTLRRWMKIPEFLQEIEKQKVLADDTADRLTEEKTVEAPIRRTTELLPTRLNSRQIVVAKYIATHPLEKKKEVAARFGIHQNTMTNWCKNKDFIYLVERLIAGSQNVSVNPSLADYAKDYIPLDEVPEDAE